MNACWGPARVRVPLSECIGWGSARSLVREFVQLLSCVLQHHADVLQHYADGVWYAPHTEGAAQPSRTGGTALALERRQGLWKAGCVWDDMWDNLKINFQLNTLETPSRSTPGAHPGVGLIHFGTVVPLHFGRNTAPKACACIFLWWQGVRGIEPFVGCTSGSTWRPCGAHPVVHGLCMVSCHEGLLKFDFNMFSTTRASHESVSTLGSEYIRY